MIGALSSLRDDAEHLNEAARTDLLDTAADEAERMNRLVNNLLDMSRLEFGAVRLKREICDIQDLIGVVLSQLGRRLQQHKIQIDLPEHLPFVSIDFVLMVQAVANLLENAAKYSLPGTPIVVRTGVNDGTSH